MLCLKHWALTKGLGATHMDEMRNIITKLDIGYHYTLTFLDRDGEEGCYNLWLDTDVSLYCLQKIYMYNGIPEEIGKTINYNKSEITKILIELSTNEQFNIREWD
jgi:hypothetical protein